MYGSNALPLPTPLAQEHRPLRLTAESSRPLPTGACHFALDRYSSGNERCPCQSFQHNRSEPGNACDCGHSACYHAASTIVGRDASEEALHTLKERVKRLEETITSEREIRDSIMLRERQAWEREVRVLREALAPFYKSEYDMRRRLLEMEDKIEINYDEQIRLQDRVMMLDDSSIRLANKHEGDVLDSTKRRKVLLGRESNSIQGIEKVNGVMKNGDGPSLKPRQSAPPSRLPSNAQLPGDAGSPRSSGILNLAASPRVRRSLPTYAMARRRPISPPADNEPRSSGFLALDFVNQINRVKSNPGVTKEAESPGNQEEQDEKEDSQSPAPVRTPPPGIVPPGPLSLPALLSADGFVRQSKGDEVRSPTKRKHSALDVLANVSAASPLVR